MKTLRDFLEDSYIAIGVVSLEQCEFLVVIIVDG